MSKNGYLEKQKIARAVREQAVRDTYIQYMTDTVCIALNSPEIMGKNVLGRERLKKFMDGWADVYNAFVIALEDGPETDVMQAKLDERLEKILGDECLPFEQRYEWLKKQRYGK